MGGVGRGARGGWGGVEIVRPSYLLVAPTPPTPLNPTTRPPVWPAVAPEPEKGQDPEEVAKPEITILVSPSTMVGEVKESLLLQQEGLV